MKFFVDFVLNNIQTSTCSNCFFQSHYADLGDFNQKNPGPIAPIPLDKVVYASITHGHTYGNFGGKKRQGIYVFIFSLYYNCYSYCVYYSIAS